jgi:hypothetical protein
MSASIHQFPGGRSPADNLTDGLPPARERHIREREEVTRDIAAHVATRQAYTAAMLWEAAAIDQGLPQAKIEQARQDVAEAYAQMVDAARRLVIIMPTDLKALVHVMMYLERSFSTLPPEIIRTGDNGEALALILVRTVRLSLREIAKYGKTATPRHEQ